MKIIIKLQNSVKEEVSSRKEQILTHKNRLVCFFVSDNFVSISSDSCYCPQAIERYKWKHFKFKSSLEQKYPRNPQVKNYIFLCLWKKSFISIPFTEELNGFLGTNCNLFFLFRVNNNQQKLLDEVFFPHLKNRFVIVLHLSKMYPAEACSAEICLPGENLRAQLVDSSSAECVLCCRVQVGWTCNSWHYYERKRKKFSGDNENLESDAR